MPDPAVLHILFDQNIPREITDWLRVRRPGWRVSHVNGVGLTGKSDPEIYRWAQAQQAIVVTFDEDFADARTFPLGTHHGIVRLRVWPTTVEMTQDALRRLSECVPDTELPGSLIIIDQNRIRLRKVC